MSITPVNWATIPSGDSAATTNAASTAPKATSEALTDKSTFLRLLVSQIKNQNPLNPTDGVQFLTQLTQFSQLEQSISSTEELQAIHQILAPPVAPTTDKSTSGTSSN